MPDMICIFVKGATNRGKSKSIVALARKMGVPNWSPIWTNDGTDIRGIVKFMDKIVALCSDNRPNNDSVDWIKSVILDKSCDIIIAACRRGGRTQDTLLYNLNQKDYDVIEAYPFRKPNGKYSKQEIELLSTTLADSILNIITKNINNE